MTDVPQTPPPSRPPVMLQVGPLKVHGPWAFVVQFLLLALLVLVLIWARPSLWMLLAGALWIVFMVYWSAAAQKATPLARSESKESRALHSNLLTLAQLLLFIPVPGLRMRFVPPATWVALLGLVVQSLGLLLAIASRRHLGRNWSHVVGSVRDHELVRSGPYRWVRHPIYSAMFLMFAGICLVAGELHALAGFALLIVAYTRKIRQEERHLREFFGPAYDDYCRETRAVIPGLL